MKFIILLSFLFSLSLFSFADSQPQGQQPADYQAPLEPVPTQAQPQSVENLEDVLPNPVDVNNPNLMSALGNDQTLKENNPQALPPDTGTLSGQAESGIISAYDANFDNIDKQVNSDISAAPKDINTNTNPDLNEASAISQNIGQADMQNLSVPDAESGLSEN